MHCRGHDFGAHLESLYYIGVALDGNPDASEEELHVPQWMPYEYAARTRPSGSPDDDVRKHSPQCKPYRTYGII